MSYSTKTQKNVINLTAMKISNLTLSFVNNWTGYSCIMLYDMIRGTYADKGLHSGG